MSELYKKIVDLEDLKRGKEIITNMAIEPNVLKVQNSTTSDQVYYRTKAGQETMKDLATAAETYEYLVGKLYNIIDDVTDGTLKGPTKISINYPTTIYIIADQNHILPNSTDISVENAELISYNPANGEVKIQNPTADVKIKAICPVAFYTYNINANIANGTIFGDTTIKSRQSVTLRIIPEKGFACPKNMTDIKITNASLTAYNSTTGELTIARPSADVIIEADCIFNGLCFTADPGAICIIKYNIIGTIEHNLQKSTDGINWEDWNKTTITIDDKLYVRNKKDTLSLNASNYLYFIMIGNITASGNCNSLINFTDVSEACFYKLFNNCTALTTVPDLPSKTLANMCYKNMFSGCTALEQVPELPAETLAVSCYSNMFSGCTSLTSAPSLPIQLLADYCYEGMFSGCTNLINPPAALLATELATGCYAQMFQNCTKLRKAPIIHATSIAEASCQNMFNGCSNFSNSATGEEPNSVAYLTTPDSFPAGAFQDIWTGTVGSYTGYPEVHHTYYYFGAFSININVTNGSFTGARWIGESDTEVINIIANTGYELPKTARDITIRNATIVSYDNTNGKLVINNATGEVTISCTCTVKTFTITKNATNCVIDCPTSIASGGIATVTIVPQTGYLYPNQSEITVVGAEILNYNPLNGIFILSNPIDNIFISITCKAQVFNIFCSVFNGSYSGATTIEYNGKATIYINSNPNYHCPDTINVVNATVESYDKTTGKIVIKNPTNFVSIGAECQLIEYSITASVVNGTVSGSMVIAAGGKATLKLAVIDKNLYSLPTLSQITIENATIDSYNAATGELVIKEPITNVIIKATTTFCGLYFTADSEARIHPYCTSDNVPCELYYSFDEGVTWTAVKKPNDHIDINPGQKLCFKNESAYLSLDTKNWFWFTFWFGICRVHGNVLSLLKGGVLYPYCFYQLFWYESYIYSAPQLPSTGLTDNCFTNMFARSKNITVNTTGDGVEFFYFSPENVTNNPGPDMFFKTGGTYTGSAVKGQRYYYKIT